MKNNDRFLRFPRGKCTLWIMGARFFISRFFILFFNI